MSFPFPCCWLINQSQVQELHSCLLDHPEEKYIKINFFPIIFKSFMCARVGLFVQNIIWFLCIFLNNLLITATIAATAQRTLCSFQLLRRPRYLRLLSGCFTCWNKCTLLIFWSFSTLQTLWHLYILRCIRRSETRM